MQGLTESGRLTWRVNRLRTMSAAEIAFRLSRKVQGTVERAGLGRARPTPARGAAGRPWLETLPRDFDVARYSEAADRILAGRFRIFGREFQLGFPPPWNRDPATGIHAPLVFGKDIDYRDRARVGDIKHVWELNRHLELVTLAQAWHLTGEARYAHGCRVLLESWLAACPYPHGVNWCVSLEHAVRLVNWSFAWHLLGSDRSPVFSSAEGAAFRARWLESVFQHCHFIAHHTSRHSSANNHLLGEAVGLLVGALTWPMWQASSTWAATAQEALEREALAQNHADGVNKEQAVWYQHAVADMMLIAGLVARANGRELGAAYWGRLLSMLEFLSSIMDAGGHVPAFGDADDGVLVRFDPAPSMRVFHSLLASGAALFGSGALKRKAQCFDDKSRWLLGAAGARSFARLPAGEAGLTRTAFPQGGYFVLGQDFDTPREVRIVADAGPLGYLSIAAHGHADALSFTLSVAGAPLLIDPGTYAYHTERKWRDYFRGTRAHNTLEIDAESQSVSGGNFMWLRHARARVESFTEAARGQRLIASHDGYLRLPAPLLHRRILDYDRERACLTVTDELSGEESHRVALHWHFAPECRVLHESQHTVIVKRAGVRLRLSCPPALDIELVRGQEDPPLGWSSTGLGQKTPCTTVVCSGRQGPGRLQSEFRIEL